MKCERFIRRYNHLNGKSVRKTTLAQFHNEIKKELDSKRIDSHSPLGIEVIAIEKKLRLVLEKMDKGGFVSIDKVVIDKPINVFEYHRRRIESQNKRMPKAIRDVMNPFHGLEEISDPSFNEGGLDGFSDTAYKVITDKLIELIESGGLLWRKPWNFKDSLASLDRARNYVTNHVYRGANFYLNWIRIAGTKVNGKIVKYESPFYLTFKQCTDLGGKVKEGEKAWPVVYFKWLYKDIAKNVLVDEKVALDQNGNLKEGYKRIPGLFYYNVFNFEQCDGVPAKESNKPVVKTTEKERIESAENIVEGMPKRPPITFEGNRAFYRPSTDSVTVPEIGFFDTEQGFYSTLFHELIHATGHPSRLNREKGKRHGDDKYAFEELIAELGACFLCGESGILYFTMKNSAAYIEGWQEQLIKVMKGDKKFFVQASSGAQAAADFILDRKAAGDKAPEDNFIDDIPEQTAISAFSHTSFHPEQRGQSAREAYVETLKDFIKEIRPLAEKVGRLEEYQKDFDRFRAKFKAITLDYLHAHSRVASSMIVGPAKFPVERNRKANASADKRMAEVLGYPRRIMKIMRNKYLPDEAKPVKSGKENSAGILEKKLAERIKTQELMVAANKIIRSKKDVESRLVDLFIQYKLEDPEALTRKLLTPDYAGRTGFAQFQLSNNNAEITRLKKRIAQEKTYGEKKAGGNQETVIEGVRVLKNYDINRVQLFFDGKPAQEVISRLKSKGFKWSPREKAWQRFLNTTPDHLVKFVIVGKWQEESVNQEEPVLSGTSRKKRLHQEPKVKRSPGRQYPSTPEKSLDNWDKGIRERIRERERQERDFERARQRPFLTGLVSAAEISKMRFRKFDLTGQYLKDFHRLYSDTQMMIWGSPGSGKTVYVLQLAQYLADTLKLKVLFVAHEELRRSTFTEKIVEFGIGHNNLKFTKDFSPAMADAFDVVFFDSINSIGMTLDDYRKFVHAHPGKMYVLVVQSTKDGDFRGGKDWEHEVDVAGEVRNRKLILRKNRLDKDHYKKAEKLMTQDAIAEQTRRAQIKKAVKSATTKPTTK